MVTIAREAGAPRDKGAGILLNKKLAIPSAKEKTFSQYLPRILISLKMQSSSRKYQNPPVLEKKLEKECFWIAYRQKSRTAWSSC
jgi:hypothetical protein